VRVEALDHRGVSQGRASSAMAPTAKFALTGPLPSRRFAASGVGVSMAGKAATPQRVSAVRPSHVGTKKTPPGNYPGGTSVCRSGTDRPGTPLETPRRRGGGLIKPYQQTHRQTRGSASTRELETTRVRVRGSGRRGMRGASDYDDHVTEARSRRMVARRENYAKAFATMLMERPLAPGAKQESVAARLITRPRVLFDMVITRMSLEHAYMRGGSCG